VLTVVVADELVEVNLGIHLLAVRIAKTGSEDVAVVNTDILSRGVERHDGGWKG
jgi:hypothetical protein